MQSITTAMRSRREISTATAATISRSGFRACRTTVGDDDHDAGAVQIHYGEPGGIQLAGERTSSTPAPVNILRSAGVLTTISGRHSRPETSMATASPTSRSARRSSRAAEATSGVAPWSSCTAASAGLLPVVGYLIHQDDPLVPDDEEDPDDFG